MDAARPTLPGGRVGPGLPQRHISGHRLPVTPGQLRRECAQPVRSNASRISMVSLPDLVTVLRDKRPRYDSSSPSISEGPHITTPRVTGRSDDRVPGILMATHQELTGRTPGFSRGR